jgi:hypothetical protein
MPEQPISYERYLSSLPPDRRDAIEQVWQVVRTSMPAGYTEVVGPKYLTFKAGEDWCVSLANQKNYISLYLTPLYVFPKLKARLDASEKKLKCGKGCINFKSAEELPLEVIGEIIAATDAEAYKEGLRRMRNEGKRRK